MAVPYKAGSFPYHVAMALWRPVVKISWAMQDVVVGNALPSYDHMLNPHQTT